MNQYADSMQLEIDDQSSPHFSASPQMNLTQQVQEGFNQAYHQKSRPNLILLGDSSKIFPSLIERDSIKCRMSSSSTLTRESTGSHQELSKKEKSQESFFRNEGSENADGFNDFASPVSTLESQNSYVLSESSLDFNCAKVKEEVSNTILLNVDGQSPDSRQNASRNLPGFVFGRAKKDCKNYFNFKKTSRKNLPEHLCYVRDIIESKDFTCYKEGLLEKHIKEIRLKENTYSGVFLMFQSTSPACCKLILRVAQSLLSENGSRSFDKWLSEARMGQAAKNALYVKKSCLLANFNEKFEGRYNF